MPNLIPNFIKKIKFELNFKVAKLKFKPEPCDLGRHKYGHSLMRYRLRLDLMVPPKETMV